jgi:hypothetical protein
MPDRNDVDVVIIERVIEDIVAKRQAAPAGNDPRIAAQRRIGVSALPITMTIGTSSLVAPAIVGKEKRPRDRISRPGRCR